MTPAEHVVWNHLRRNRLGVRFRRQHATGPYSLDFVCLAKELVVEIDGPWHDLDSPEEHQRKEYIESYGFRILRFTNDEVFDRNQQLVERIIEALEER